MKLITEQIDDVQYLTETTENGEKKLYITGPFSEADVVNHNKRKYPLPILEKEIARYNKEYVATNKAIGQLSHPDNPSLDLSQISHRITELKQDGNVFHGKALILSTPTGEIVKGLLNGGVSLGISSRALGSLMPSPTNEGYNIVQEDLKIICWDIVATPSSPGAWVQGIMEQREYVYDLSKGSYIEQEVEQLYESLPKLSTKEIESTALSLFNWYLSGINLRK